MNDNLLAFYMGYAFSQAIQVQHVLEPGALMVPFNVYWQHMQPFPVPYPAATQLEAVDKAHAARLQKESEVSGWSSGREGTIQQNTGSALDVLFIEGWIPGLTSPLEMFVYYKKEPLRLIRGLLWKSHPEARKHPQTFMAEFKNGIIQHPFGNQSMGYVERAEPANFVAP